MKRCVLEIEYDFDFKLWGIAAPLRDFQACLLINRVLRTHLSRCDDIEKHTRQRTDYYSVFRYEDEMDKGIFHLIGNKHNGARLVPEARHADFLLRFCGTVPDGYLQEMVTKLKSIERFAALIPLQPDKLKSRMNLVVE